MEAEVLSALGVVERIDQQGFAYVRTQRQTACGGCQAEGTCGTGALSRLFKGSTQSLVKVSNSLNARPGDQVELSLKGTDLLKQALMAYGLPLFGFFSTALLSQALWPGLVEWVLLVFALFGMLIAWYAVKCFARPVMPEILRVVRGI